MILPRVAQSFGRQAMMTTLGAALLHAEGGTCRIWAPIADGFTQQHGYGHAGLTFALGDSAAGYAALSLMDEDAEVLTAEMKINLLAPAKGGTMLAEGRVLHPGRRLIVVTASVLVDDVPIAALQGTMIAA